MKTARLWIGIFLVPLLFNAFVRFAIFGPLQKRLGFLQTKYAFVQDRPRLEAALQESDRILQDWEQGVFPAGDSTAVNAAVERLAKQCRIQVAEVKTKPAGQSSVPGISVQALDVELLGSFHRLARWVSDVEAHPGFQIESFTIAPGKESDLSVQLTSKMTALMRGTVGDMSSKQTTGLSAKQLFQKLEAYRGLSSRRGTYDVVFYRDPMRVPINEQGKVVVPGGLRGGRSVVGVIWSPEHPFVVIDQELFSEGQAIGPYTLLKIEQDGVIARKQNEQVWVPLARSSQE